MEKIEPKKLRAVNSKTMVVALDIGKETNTGYCRCPDRSEVKPFTFRNNRANAAPACTLARMKQG